MKDTHSHIENINQVNKDAFEYIGFVNKSEDERLKENIFRTPLEKLSLFTRMLKRESLFKKAKIIHK